VRKISLTESSFDSLLFCIVYCFV